MPTQNEPGRGLAVMPNPISNDELDWLIWRDLRDQDGHPTNSAVLVAAAGGNWRRIDSRIQAMRKAGRLKFWHWKPRPAHGRSHGWEVLGCPGDGGSEDGSQAIVERHGHEDPRVVLLNNTAKLQSAGVNLAVLKFQDCSLDIYSLDLKKYFC